MDDETIMAVRRSMSSVPPDFWSVVGQTELDMYVSIAAGTLAHDVDGLIEDFRDHHARVNNRRMWGSVFDNATFVLSKYRTRANPPEVDCRGSAPRRTRIAGGSCGTTCTRGIGRHEEERSGAAT